MELQFNKSVCACLRRIVSRTQTQELTQEVKLSDAMPDVGRILGCWGQILIRGKEWRSGGMTVSGGVLAWVLYAPEDGSVPQSVDSWIPFQLKWEFQDTERDGYIHAVPYMQGLDCRSVSARKLMIRCGISIAGEAMEPTDVVMFTPGSVPEDVQLLKQTYPALLPQEAGEKTFSVEDEISLPMNIPQMGRVICYEARPQVKEFKVMAGKLVFRGACSVHIVYFSDKETVNGWDQDIAFSQFVDLDRDYGPSAGACISVIVTGIELDSDDAGNYHIKCGLAAQYQIYDRVNIEIVEDAYSVRRNVSKKEDLMELPVLLDSQSEERVYHLEAKADGIQTVDTALFLGAPSVVHNADVAEAEIPVQFQVFYLDEAGSLQEVTGKNEIKWDVRSDDGNEMYILADAVRPQSEFAGDAVEVNGTVNLSVHTFRNQRMPMVTALELGEACEPDPGRPSLVLRRLGSNRIWDLAKEYGSTVESITLVNDLQQEPLPDTMLLIPVT